MLILTINNVTELKVPKIKNSLKALTKKTAETLNYKENKAIELTFVTDKEIRKINKVYRKKDKATDVISFAFEESESFPNEKLLGEIYISIETANKQAKERNQSLKKEIEFLFIHGLLHIFGFDHNTDTAEKEMNEIAYKVLSISKTFNKSFDKGTSKS